MSLICDLHSHSTVSDGTLPPAEVVDAAIAAGVNLLALTDHDALDGLSEARARAAQRLELINGVELSVSEGDGALQLHILGLGIDPVAPDLHTLLEQAQAARRERGARMVERLNELGIPLELEHVTRIAGPGALGRPHVARALVEIGACSSEDEAFTRFLRRGRPAHIEQPERSAAQAIRAIHAAGGLASWAHPPLSIGVDGAGGLLALTTRLAALGLDALEVTHPRHKRTTRRDLRRLARDHNLLTTGGSDFHGGARPPSTPGGSDLATESDALDALRRRMAQHRAMV